MVKSMTAYARESFSSAVGSFVLEIHSVNRKGLDLSLHLPRDYLCFDIEIRKWLSAALERGQVTLRLHLAVGETSSSVCDMTELKRLKEEWDGICQAVGLKKEDVNLPFLLSHTGSSLPEEHTFKPLLQAAVEEVLKKLLQMKQVEGAALAEDIQARLQSIEQTSCLVEPRRELPVLAYRKKITERLQDLTPRHPDLEERIAREVALLAEKMDIAEELVRLRAHIAAFRSHLQASKSVGRTLDFLAQEMHREINTLGSKSQDGEISSYVIQMKSELDRIREQVQNIE